MTDFTDTPRTCGAELELQGAYLKALCVIPLDQPEAEPGDVFDVLRCALAAGHDGRHHGLARSLPMAYPGEVWACWDSGQQPAALLNFPDCCELDPRDRDEACVLFNGHAGAHSWAHADPDEDELRARLDLVPPQPSGRAADVVAQRPTRPAGPTAPTPPAAPTSCEHRRIEKRDGKTYCRRCHRQIYI